MSWRIFRSVWVTACNVLFVGFIGLSLLGDYRLYQLSSPPKPPRVLFDVLGPVLLIALLAFGIVSEWFDWTWLAVSINAGFFAFLGFGVLGKALLTLMMKPTAPYHPEAGLTVAIVGIPCAVIALADCVMYWITRRRPGSIAELM